MEWTVPETITVGTIIFGVLMLLNRFLGQRADPKLLEVFKQALEGFGEIKDEIKNNTTITNKAFALLTENINLSNSAYMALVDRVELSERLATEMNNKFVSTLTSFRDSVTKEHQTGIVETQKIVPQIVGKLDELKQQQANTEKSNQGLKATMDKVTISQHKVYQEILEGIRRIETSLEEWKRDSSEKIEKIEQDLVVVKEDIVKAKPPATPAPANQPIVKPTPPPSAPKITQLPTEDTKPTEKEAKNE